MKKILILLLVFLNFNSTFSSQVKQLQQKIQEEIGQAIEGMPIELTKIIAEYAMPKEPDFFVLKIEDNKLLELFKERLQKRDNLVNVIGSIKGRYSNFSDPTYYTPESYRKQLVDNLKINTDIIFPIHMEDYDVKAVGFAFPASGIEIAMLFLLTRLSSDNAFFKIKPGHRYTLRLRDLSKPCSSDKDNVEYTTTHLERGLLLGPDVESAKRNKPLFFCVQEEPLTTQEIWNFSNQMENEGLL